MARVDLSFILTLDRRKSAAPSLCSPKGRLVRCGLNRRRVVVRAWLQRVLLRGARGRRRAARLFRDLWNPAHLLTLSARESELVFLSGFLAERGREEEGNVGPATATAAAAAGAVAALEQL